MLQVILLEVIFREFTDTPPLPPLSDLEIRKEAYQQTEEGSLLLSQCSASREADVHKPFLCLDETPQQHLALESAL